MAISPPKPPPKAPARSTVAITPAPAPAGAVPQRADGGLASARDRVRRRGPFVALLVPAITAGLSAIVLEIPATGHTSNMLGIVGSVLALLAVPTAVAFGIPVEVGPVRAGLAIATSLVLWALLGWWASRRVSQRGDRRMAGVVDRVRVGDLLPLGRRAHRRRRAAAPRGADRYTLTSPSSCSSLAGPMPRTSRS